MGDTTPPSLSFWDRIPPFGAVAAAKIASVALIVTPDAKGTKDTVPTLKFANGYVRVQISCKNNPLCTSYMYAGSCSRGS